MEKQSQFINQIITQIGVPTKKDLKLVFETTNLPELEEVFLKIQKQLDMKTQNIQDDAIHYILDQVENYGKFEILVEGKNSERNSRFLSNRLKSFYEFGEKGYEFLVQENKITIFDPNF